MMANKHAYLIIAHKSDETFYTLLQLLDDPMNDIYVHMDIKNDSFSENTWRPKYSHLYYTERTNVTWGGYSQIRAELILLSGAIKRQYQYYHLLSGEDLPIKTQQEIHHFFDSCGDKIFVDFYSDHFTNFDRVRYYHLFQEYLGRRNTFFANKLFINMQIILHINRNQGIRFAKGANWFSIPHDFAAYVVSKERWIKHTFKYSFCCDEVFLQTILINSQFIDRLFYQGFDNNTVSMMREIDWKRGDPYIFRIDDLQQLKTSDRMFARKFNSKIDVAIINAIKQYIMNTQTNHSQITSSDGN